MPVYQEIPEDELRAILDLYAKESTVLDSERVKELAFQRHTPCPRCGGPVSPCFSSVQTVFQAGSLLPRHNYKCRMCEAEFSPETGMLFKLGNPGAAIERALSYQTPWINPGTGE